MIKRLLLACATLVACVAAGAAYALDDLQSRQWQFDVSLDGKPIGYHTFELTDDGERQVLETEASFDVKILFVTAFRYRHRNTEIWSNGCLASIDAATDNNGKRLEVRGALADDAFSVSRPGGDATLPDCVQTFAYWNPQALDSEQLLNSQTGAYENVSLTFESRDRVSVAGQPVDALRYRLSADAGDIVLWYAATDGTWLGLEAPAKGGRKIRYEAVVVPDAAGGEQLAASSS